MISLDLFHNHPEFFDLEFVRRTFKKTEKLTDQRVIQSMLDPENATPFDPNCIFDTDLYSERYLVGENAAGQNPILHYLSEGAAEGACPNQLFDPNYFHRNAGPNVDQYPTVVEHALANMAGELPAFHPFIDANYIFSSQEHVSSKEFYEALFRAKIDVQQPHPLFDVEFIRKHADCKIQSLQDAIAYYWDAGADVATHALFDIDHYQSNFEPDAGILHSVYHYIVSTQPPSPQPLLDADYYRDCIRATLAHPPSHILEHFIIEGQKAGLGPSPFFDLEYYRYQSGCGQDALQHYVAGGHRQFSPHPMVRVMDDRVLSRAFHRPEISTGCRLAQRPDTVSLSATPDFDPVYYGNIIQNKTASAAELRDHYLRNAYPKGERPNGLLAHSFISARCRALEANEDDSMQTYIRQGMNRHKRLLIALESFGDTVANRGWLALVQSQLSNRDIEFVVVALQSGPLTNDFADVAHIWHLSGPSSKTAPLGVLLRSGLRLSEVLASNMPVAAFIEANSGTKLADALADLDTQKLVFGGGGLKHIAAEDAIRLAASSEQILCDTIQIKSSLEQHFPSGEHTATAGFHSTLIPALTSSTLLERRRRARIKLGLPDDAIIVVGNGPLDMANSVDLFGAVAANCLSHPDCTTDVYFIWHGEGREFPDTPAFYAKYFVHMAAGPDRIRITADLELRDALSASDIYLKLSRGNADMSGVAEAKAAGLPIVISKNYDEAEKDAKGAILLEAFNIDAVNDALLELIANPKDRKEKGKASHKDISQNTNLSSFIERINTVLSGAQLDCQLRPHQDIQKQETMLIVADEDIFSDLFELQGQDDFDGGLAVVRIDPSLITPNRLPTQLYKIIDSSGVIEIVLCASIEGFDREYISEFGHAIWLAEGLLSEFDDFYRLGLSFDEIRVCNPTVIAEMSKINPHIAAKMSTFDEQAR